MSTLQEIEVAVTTLPPKDLVSLEMFVRDLREQTQEQELEELQRRTGFYPLPRRSDAVVTNELVQSIRDEEGI